jgi:small subunit ribosomal protein S6
LGTYEIVAVLRPDLDDEGLGAALDRVNQRISEHGGNVVSVDRWGKRKLAYPIKKHRDGYYALFVFSLEADRIGPLRQILGLHEDMLRFVLASHHPKPAPAAAPAAPGQAAAAPAPVTAPAPAAHREGYGRPKPDRPRHSGSPH